MAVSAEELLKRKPGAAAGTSLVPVQPPTVQPLAPPPAVATAQRALAAPPSPVVTVDSAGRASVGTVNRPAGDASQVARDAAGVERRRAQLAAESQARRAAVRGGASPAQVLGEPPRPVAPPVPQAPTQAPGPAARPGVVGRAAARVAQAAGRAADRLSAPAPAPATPPSGLSRVVRGAGRALAPVALGLTAGQVANTGTGDYRKRFGLEDRSRPFTLPAQALQLAGMTDAAEMWDDTAIRAGGAITDLVNVGGIFDGLMADKPERITPAGAALAAAPAPAAPATPAAGSGAAGATPPDGSRVLGQFNGRDITADEAATRAGQLPSASGPVVFGPNGSYAAATGGDSRAATPSAAQSLAAPASGPIGAIIGGDDSSFLEQIDKQISELGPLNMRSKRDLVGQLLGLKGREVGRAADATVQQGIEQGRQSQAAAADQLRADVDREQIAAGERNSRRSAKQQTVTGEDGALYSFNDEGGLAPITGPDGKTFKPAPTRATAGKSQQEIAAELLAQTLPPGATPQEVAAAVQTASQAAAALANGGQMPAGQRPTLAQLKALNPQASEEELKAYYADQYGDPGE